MIASLLAVLSLAASLPAAAAAGPAAPDADRPPPAPGATAAPELRLPSTGVGPGSVILPAAALAALAGAALVLRRKRLSPGRRVQVLERTVLGAKRSLVLARLGDDLLLLGSSEAGIQLLCTQPAPPEQPAPAAPRPPATPQPRSPARRAPAAPAALSGLVASLRRARPGTAGSPGFDALLAESVEDQELRRKLAGGQRGSVR